MRFLLLLTLLLCISVSALEMPKIFGSHMVLLQNEPIVLHGRSKPGKTVTVYFASGRWECQANQKGEWKIELSPRKAGGPYELYLKDDSSELHFRDVMVGEVWLVSGQSNMSFPLYSKTNRFDRCDNGKVLAEKADLPNLRLCRNFQWKRCTPSEAMPFSAIGFLFGKELMKQQDVPVGIIQAAFPATRIQAWLPEEALRKADVKADVQRLDKRDQIGKEKVKDLWMQARNRRHKYYLWKSKGGKGTPPPPFTKEDNAIYQEYGQNFPSTQYNSRILPWQNFPIRGILWYQGESNTEKREGGAALYRKLFPLLVESWRKRWVRPEPVFLYAQLSAWEAHRRTNPLPDDFWKTQKKRKSEWAELREAQESALDRIPRSGMIVTLDIGDHSNIHPTNKITVAERFLREAMRLCYGQNTPRHPRFRRAEPKGNTMRLFFSSTEGGLLPENTSIDNFEVAGEDAVYHPAKARTDGTTVLVQSAQVPHPRFVRYAWSNYPGGVKLLNKAGLPCGSFRSQQPQDTPQK